MKRHAEAPLNPGSGVPSVVPKCRGALNPVISYTRPVARPGHSARSGPRPAETA